jgi:hypothetical protein
LLNLVRRFIRPRAETPGFVFSRPLVVLQSDDWGRIGIRDREGYEALRAKGINLGGHPYDQYSFETAEDVNELAAMLLRHHDSVGRSPCLVMSFCTANLDFTRMRAQGFKHIELLPLAQGFPGAWKRPDLLEAYRSGIRAGVFYPAMHGLTHLCPLAVENALAKGGERADLLRAFWEAETPYIHWRMPWVGFEYWNPERPHAGFLSAELQSVQIRKARECFVAFFGRSPASACPPGYFANADTRRAWRDAGIRVAQNGPSSGFSAPYLDKSGLLHLHRTLDLEPCHRELDLEKYMEIAATYFARGLPLIISTHSINFHSTLRDFRTATLAALDSLLSALESKYPELLYVHDEDVYGIVTEGVFHGRDGRVPVQAKSGWKRRVATQGAM